MSYSKERDLMMGKVPTYDLSEDTDVQIFDPVPMVGYLPQNMQ